MKHPIEGIRNAFARAHAIITGQLVNGQRAHYMSVPPDRARDVDLIITDAIDELAELRPAVAALTAERDAALARLAAAEATVERLREALVGAATSLRTISNQAGRDPYMEDMLAVRGYANNRAGVAEFALAPRANGGGETAEPIPAGRGQLDAHGLAFCPTCGRVENDDE